MQLVSSLSLVEGTYTLSVSFNASQEDDAFFIENFEFSLDYPSGFLTYTPNSGSSDFGIYYVNDLGTGRLVIGAIDISGKFVANSFADAYIPLATFEFTPIDGANDFDFKIVDAIVNALQPTDIVLSHYTNDAPTGGLAIIGDASQNSKLEAISTINDSDGMGQISYQWFRGDVAISGATSAAYTLLQADVDSEIHVVASYQDSLGFDHEVSSQPTGVVINLNDSPEGEVIITGAAEEDQILTATNTISDADGLGEITYQWLRDGVEIDGATSSTYTLGDLDVGKKITVTANYVDGFETKETVTSLATVQVVNINDTPSGAITLPQSPKQGDVISVVSTLVDNDGLGELTYTWYRDGVEDTDIKGSSYQLIQDDVGSQFSVSVTYIDGQGTSEQVSSNTANSVANINDSPLGSVSISGTANEDSQLTASNNLSDADGLGTITYQWLRDGSAISGATSATYTLAQADVGAEISVKASYTDAFGTAESVTSVVTDAISNVNDVAQGTVTITGTAQEDGVLTASNNLTDEDGLGTITYQWLRDGTAVSGATSATYTLAQADVGAEISVKASYTDAFGTSESVASASTDTVSNVNDAPQGSVTITGDLRVTKILSASNDLQDGDGLGDISYQWYRNDEMISGATSQSYTLNEFDLGAQISVVASYLDDFGASESVTSLQTDPIQPEGITFTGSIYHWNSHALLSGIKAVAEGNEQLESSLSDATGQYELITTIDIGNFSLFKETVSTDTKGVVTSADALAALKIAVGINPNPDPDGNGELQPLEVSPYQLIAADVNGDGRVTSSDALEILKASVGLTTTSQPRWEFVSEVESFWDETSSKYTLSRTSIKWDDDGVDLATAESVKENYVAVLIGDVNGNWKAPADSEILDITYFEDLESRGVGPVEQWMFIA